MAEAPANPSFGGYDDEFVDEVKDDWHCPICQLTLKEPVQTVVCGHRFCRQCLDGHFLRQEHNNQQLSCPVDRNCVVRDKDIFPDKAAERMILSFIIKCPSAGCEWTGELRTKTAHQNECRRFPLDCPNNCGVVIPREEIPAHIEKDCRMAVISCPYAEMGCATKVQWKAVEIHLQSDMRLHLDLACIKISDTRKELSNTKKELRSTQEESRSTQEELRSAQEELRGTQEELHNTQEELRNTQEELHNTQEELHNTQEELRDSKETTSKLEEKISAFENKPLICQRVFTWKISGFNEILAQAKTGQKTKFDSAPFYMGECGYKFRMRLYPNGHGSGENTHLAVFISIMKGEYDSILNWPFNQRITFRWIDQQEDPDDRENIVKSIWRNRGHVKCNVRPLAEENPGQGFLEFVSHDKMLERRYLVDDTMFIQLQVGPAYLS